MSDNHKQSMCMHVDSGECNRLRIMGCLHLVQENIDQKSTSQCFHSALALLVMYNA